MKRIISGLLIWTAFISLAAYSCKGKGIPTIERKLVYKPTVVVDSCTGKWAIQTYIEKFYRGKDTFKYKPRFFGFETRDDEINDLNRAREGWVWVHSLGEDTVKDTSAKAYIGNEFQFSTRSDALKTYASWFCNPDTLERKREIYDSINKIEQRIKDSIFKCQHTYKEVK